MSKTNKINNSKLITDQKSGEIIRGQLGIHYRPQYLLSIFILVVMSTILISSNSYAGIHYQHAVDIYNSSDNAEKFSFNSMRNFLFVGATVGIMQKLVIGQSAVIWNKSNKSGGGDNSTLSMVELGPRLIVFFDEGRTFSTSFAFNPYAKGKRKLPGGDSEEISGYSYFISVSYQLKITKMFYAGASFFYHGLAITNSTVGNTENKVSHSYTNYFPLIEFSLRFK